MYSQAKCARDPFTFSLRGMAAVNSYALVPAVANDDINRAWDARLSPAQGSGGRQEPSAVTRHVETLLARYFAPGCCDAA